MAETFASESGLSLIPTDDEDLLAANDQLAAAEASISDDIFATPTTAPAKIPFGRSWAWDRDRERYVRQGSAPAEVRGRDALRQWIYAAARTAQGVHAIFSDEYGMEEPDDWIGVLDPSDALETFEPRFREAVLQHERIEAVDQMTPKFDPNTGIITVADLVIVTDEAEAVPILPFDISPTAF